MPSRPWGPKEIQTLRQLVNTHTNDQIARRLGRSSKAVAIRLSELKINVAERPTNSRLNSQRRMDWSARAFIRLNRNRGPRVLARHLNTTVAEVQNALAEIRRDCDAGTLGPLAPGDALPMAPYRGAPPPSPTDAQPGTAEKQRVMTVRDTAGYSPHHPLDARAKPTAFEASWHRDPELPRRFFPMGRMMR